MPIWVKTYSSTGTIDELTGVVALDDGVAACGRTFVTDNINGDTWIPRANVDAMVRFTSDSGLSTENTAAQWQRLTHHTLRALTPQATNTTMIGDSNSQLLDDATVIGELVTD